MYYVYAYFDPDTLKPFYIGKGSGDRSTFHLRKASIEKNTGNVWKDRKIKKLLSKEKSPIIKVIRTFDLEIDAYEFEKNLISKRIGNGVLTNMCPDNRPPSQKGKKFENRKAPSNKGKPGRKWSQEEKEAHSLRMKDYMSSADVREKLSVSKIGSTPWNKGIEMSEAHKENMRIANSKLTTKINRANAKLGDKNPAFGKIMINDGFRNRFIPKGDAIPEGWSKGKLWD